MSKHLVSIVTVNVDKDLPRNQRCAEFKRQIQDMYNFESQGFTVRAAYADNGATLEDCLRGMLAK